MDASLLDSVRTAYEEDKFFSPVIAHPERYPAYTLYDDLLFYYNRLCIPANEKRSSPRITMIVIISATAKHEQLLLPTTSSLALRMISIHTSDHAIHVHERNQRYRLQQDFSIRFPYLPHASSRLRWISSDYYLSQRSSIQYSS
jgi:hypothetical protein